jgi:proline dehydrogenase
LLENIEEIVKKAAEKNSFIRIDMEDSQCVDKEIDIYRKLQKKYPNHVGLVIQAYLRRTLTDIENFSDIHVNGTPLNFRLCKGIYIEPKQIAFKEHDEIQNHYIEDLQFMLDHNMYVGIATHDKKLVDEALRLIAEKHISKDKYEFQMLYGVTPELRSSNRTAGTPDACVCSVRERLVRLLDPRLKENPKIASHIIKAIFFKG